MQKLKTIIRSIIVFIATVITACSAFAVAMFSIYCLTEDNPILLAIVMLFAISAIIYAVAKYLESL